MIGRLTVNAGVQTLVIRVIKIIGDAVLGVSQIGKTGHSRSSSTFILRRYQRLLACVLS
jgi:hypothetical protein